MKKRFSLMIESDALEMLRAIKARTGLSESEQIRQSIQWWIASREWPVRRRALDEPAGGQKVSATRWRRR